MDIANKKIKLEFYHQKHFILDQEFWVLRKSGKPFGRLWNVRYLPKG